MVTTFLPAFHFAFINRYAELSGIRGHIGGSCILTAIRFVPGFARCICGACGSCLRHSSPQRFLRDPTSSDSTSRHLTHTLLHRPEPDTIRRRADIFPELGL